MKKFLFATVCALATFCAQAQAEVTESQSSTESSSELSEPRLPTHKELVQIFTEGIQISLKNAAEWSGGNKAKEEEIIKKNTVSAETIEQVAKFTEGNLKAQLQICQDLQSKYAKSKSGICLSAVMSGSGLGHFDQHHQLMKSLSDKKALQQLVQTIKSPDFQKKYSQYIKTLETGKIYGQTSTADEMNDTLSIASALTLTQKQIQAALKAHEK